jgi:hypothetical protein
VACQGNFSNIGEQLQKILLEFIANDTLTKLIYYTHSTPMSEPSLDNPNILLNTQIYPQTYKPPTDRATVYIFVYFDNFYKDNSNPYFKHGNLNVSIVCHRDLWVMKDAIRPYEIMNEIDNILNRKNVSGALSKEWFSRATYLAVSDLYNCMSLTYSNWDL